MSNQTCQIISMHPSHTQHALVSFDVCGGAFFSCHGHLPCVAMITESYAKKWGQLFQGHKSNCDNELCQCALVSKERGRKGEAFLTTPH